MTKISSDDTSNLPEDFAGHLYSQEHRILVAIRRYFGETWSMPKDAPRKVGARVGLVSCVVSRLLVGTPLIAGAAGGIYSALLLLKQVDLLSHQNKLLADQNTYFQQQIAEQDRRAAAAEEMARISQRHDYLRALHSHNTSPTLREAEFRAFLMTWSDTVRPRLIGIDLKNTQIVDLDIHGDLIACDLTLVEWRNIRFTGDMSGSRLVDSTLIDCDWSAATGTDVVLATAIMKPDGLLSDIVLREGVYEVELRGDKRLHYKTEPIHPPAAVPEAIPWWKPEFTDDLLDSSQAASSLRSLADIVTHICSGPLDDKSWRSHLVVGNDDAVDDRDAITAYAIDPAVDGANSLQLSELWLASSARHATGGASALPNFTNVRWILRDKEPDLVWELLADIAAPSP